MVPKLDELRVGVGAVGTVVGLVVGSSEIADAAFLVLSATSASMS